MVGPPYSQHARRSPVFNSSSFALKICQYLVSAVFFVLKKFRSYRINIDEDVERIRRWISKKTRGHKTILKNSIL